MKIVTIGSFPNDSNVPNWFKKVDGKDGLASQSFTQSYTEFIKNNTEPTKVKEEKKNHHRNTRKNRY